MYKHVLIPSDGSEVAEKAVGAGIEFARTVGAKITAFTAVGEYELPRASEMIAHKRVVSLQEHQDRVKRDADAILAKIAKRAAAAGVECDADYALCNRPHEAIIAAANRHGCDLIFMASHGRSGLSALLHGSETRDVLTHSTIPTLVYR
ncbi:MAG TPA: universal stress protein [Burkholderiales bacterium]|jgi:nucleotide-binding universal stress UspA family protein|nr:universal stress protein [Burkholderiales bacterium]